MFGSGEGALGSLIVRDSKIPMDFACVARGLRCGSVGDNCKLGSSDIATEFRPAQFLPEYILIGNDAKKIELVFGTSENERDILRGQKSIHSGFPFDSEGWVNGASRNASNGIGSQQVSLVVRQRMGQNIQHGKMADSKRGSLPNVLHEESSKWHAASGEVPQHYGLDRYVGPQLSFGGFFRADHQTLGGGNQEDGSRTKNGSKRSQNQRAEGDPKLIVKGEETVEASKPTWPLIFTLLFVLLPAIGVVVGFVGSGRLSHLLSIGCYGLWLFGLLGVGIMVGLG